jgi:hypothetical protein
MPSISANSWAAASTVSGSAHTRDRGERSRLSSRPTASARRYGGMGCGISNRNVLVPGAGPGEGPAGPADITTESSAGTVTDAS